MTLTDHAPLPAEYEPIEDMKSRYPEAVKRKYIIEDIMDGLVIRPSASRRHVFDFVGGLRLIVSVETYRKDNCRRALLHISFGADPDQNEHIETSLEAAETAYGCFMDISGIWLGELRSLSSKMSDHGVLHWFYDVDLIEGFKHPPAWSGKGEW